MRETDQDAGQPARTLDRLTGAILDRRYRIDEKLAAGGFGSIYRAKDLVMGRDVALKILHRELTRDAQVVERFKREASALAKLRDPHTITMYDVGESPDGTRYIVMELLRGESLHDLFHASGKRLPWRRVIAIARGVCSSLREAHAVGIVHRDLKPANIHLERHTLTSDYVKVLDFGIAKLIDRAEPNRDLTFHGQMIGTFDYMPPEQMIGGITTGKSDVFTLGVVLYEMIGGVRPFGDAVGPASRLMTLLGTTPVPLGERATIPQAVERIIMRAIERDPELRPDIYQLDEELERIIDMESDGARFTEDDGPTWVEPQKPVRITPLRVPNATRAPGNISRRVSDTMLGSAATITPARGVPIVPRAPATPTQPSVFALGSRTAIPPVAATPAPPAVAPVVPQPVKVRFVTPSKAPVPPARLPTGTSSPARLPTGTSSPLATEPGRAATDDAWKRQARDAFIRGAVYALLLVIVAATIYYFY